MNVLLFGATGMVGQAALRECLLAPDVATVITLGRSATGETNAKLREVVQPNVADLSALTPALAAVDACFFCLGVSSVGMSEADYTKLTFDLTMAIATPLSRINPAITFVYVSGKSTDSTEHGSSMWARVKGRTENALLALPFKAAYMFRPGFIMPLNGVTSKTPLYRAIYALAGLLYPILRRLTPDSVTTSEQIGRAMLGVARNGYHSRVLETKDINLIDNPGA